MVWPPVHGRQPVVEAATWTSRHADALHLHRPVRLSAAASMMGWEPDANQMILEAMMATGAATVSYDG